MDSIRPFVFLGGMLVFELALAAKHKITWKTALQNMVAITAVYCLLEFVTTHCK